MNITSPSTESSDICNEWVGTIRQFDRVSYTEVNTLLVYGEHLDMVDVVVVVPGLYGNGDDIIESKAGIRYRVMINTKFTISKKLVVEYSTQLDSINIMYMEYFHKYLKSSLISDVSQLGKYFLTLSSLVGK